MTYKRKYTIDQAIELLYKGNKIRNDCWAKSYIYQDSKGVIMSHSYLRGDSEANDEPYHITLKYLKTLYGADEFCFECIDENYNAVGKEEPQPCTVCGLNDHWNSKNKSNKWVCYKHC